MTPTVVTGLLGIGGKLLDKFFPDPAERERAKLQLMEMQGRGELQEMELSLGAILAEANSRDKWTSRARPSFMYVFYLILVSLVLLAPLIGVFVPEAMKLFYANVKLGFAAIPEPLWWTFTTGYLGYTTAREYGKTQDRKIMSGMNR